MSMLTKIVVLLRSPNFHRHRGGWLPRNLTVFLASLFLKNCPSLPPSCESSKCRVIWSLVNARRHRPPSPRVRFPTRAIRSAWRFSYAARTSLVARLSQRVSLTTCVPVLGRAALAAVLISIHRSYGRLYVVSCQWLTSRKWSCLFDKNFGLNMLNSSWISFAFSCQGC